MMKKTLLILAIAMMTIGASAQVRFGVKAGVGVNTLHIGSEPPIRYSGRCFCPLHSPQWRDRGHGSGRARLYRCACEPEV